MLRIQRQFYTLARRPLNPTAIPRRLALSSPLKPKLPTTASGSVGLKVGANCGKLAVAYAVSKRFYNGGGNPQGINL